MVTDGIIQKKYWAKIYNTVLKYKEQDAMVKQGDSFCRQATLGEFPKLIVNTPCTPCQWMMRSQCETIEVKVELKLNNWNNLS